VSIVIEPVVIEPVVVGVSSPGEREALHRVRGELTFATAASAHATGIGMLVGGSGNGVPHGHVMVLDCSSVTEADSAGLAVLLDWRREALQRGIVLRYRNLPATIAQLAHISGVECLLTAE
jgi:phospholipid transport system transporter-binding protein